MITRTKPKESYGDCSSTTTAAAAAPHTPNGPSLCAPHLPGVTVAVPRVVRVLGRQ